MQNNDLHKIHQQADDIINGKSITNSQWRYEFLMSPDRGWIPCNVVEADTTNELLKIVYPHPDGEGWMDITGAAGTYDEVVPFWRVRLRSE